MKLGAEKYFIKRTRAISSNEYSECFIIFFWGPLFYKSIPRNPLFIARIISRFFSCQGELLLHGDSIKSQ